MNIEKTFQGFNVSDDKYGHIAKIFPTRKKGRQYSSTADVYSEPYQRDEDIKDEAFFFISQLSQEDQKQD
jgi:hypothetical protein